MNRNTRYNVKQYYGKKRDNSLRDILEEGGFLITTYETLKNNIESLKQEDDGDDGKKDIIWDYVILDEGHKIKVSTCPL